MKENHICNTTDALCFGREAVAGSCPFVPELLSFIYPQCLRSRTNACSAKVSGAGKRQLMVSQSAAGRASEHPAGRVNLARC
jgi:hypothetical protein